MSELDWIATVCGEYGGPMIVCSETDYLRWSGSLPLPLEQRRVLHYWGQFTAKLPAPYAQDGGHVFREHETHEALALDFEALLTAIRTKWPKATIERDEALGSATVGIHGRRMTIEQAPMSNYDRACGALDEVGVQSFETQAGLRGTAVLWEKQGGGLVDLAVSPSRDELVLLRTWVNDEADQATARAFVTEAVPDGEELELTLDGRRVIVAYSPHAWLTMLPETAFERAGAAADRATGRALLEEAFHELVGDVAEQPKLLDGPEDRDVACVLDLEPGTYRVSAGSHEDDEWSAIWCRLRRS